MNFIVLMSILFVCNLAIPVSGLLFSIAHRQEKFKENERTHIQKQESISVNKRKDLNKLSSQKGDNEGLKNRRYYSHNQEKNYEVPEKCIGLDNPKGRIIHNSEMSTFANNNKTTSLLVTTQQEENSPQEDYEVVKGNCSRQDLLIL